MTVFPSLARPEQGRFAVKALLIALAYLASGKLGLAIPAPVASLSLFWLSAGIAVAALLRMGWSYWPGILLGAFATELLFAKSVPLALIIAATNTLAPLVTVWLLQRWKFPPAFNNQRAPYLLIAASAIGMTLSATGGVGTLWAAQMLPTADVPSAWLNWWLGDNIGVLLATPLLLSLSRCHTEACLHKPLEPLICLATLSLAGWFMFLSDFTRGNFPLAFLPLPLVILSALRRGIFGASTSAFLLSLFAAIGTSKGSGIFGHLPPDSAMYVAWAYMFTLVLIVLMISSLLGERRQIEDSLTTAYKLLRETQNVARTGSWRIDAKTQVLQWSDETYRLFGIPPGTPMNDAQFMRCVHPDDREKVEAAWQAALKGNPYLIQHRIVVDGAIRWIEERANLEFDEQGQLTGAAGSCQDITDNKLAEQRARQSEHRYEALIRQAADALFVHDMEGNFVEVNQQAWDSLGYSREELLRMNVMDTSPNFMPEKGKELWSRLEPGKPHSITTVKRRKDGSIFPVEIRFAALELDGRKLVMTLVRDITERQQAEQQLLNALRQLEEKELAKTRFLAAASHDLRQPLAAANLYVEALKLRSPTTSQSELIQKLEQSMDVFSSQLSRLLDISKFDAGVIKPEIEPVKLAELFDWAARNFSGPAHQHKLAFRIHPLPKATIVLRTDIGLTESILMNIVSNAIKFTERGGILIGARIRKDKVLLQVWDTGIGIAESDLPKIFDEFYQVANPHRNRDAGLGLGLCIAKRAINLLGGEISCRSRLGRGSVFEISLPYERRSKKRTEHPEIEEPARQDGDTTLFRDKRIVFLEDDELVADAMQRSLISEGADVRHFFSAEEALKLDDIDEADLYIVDYSLGKGMTGLDFLNAVQKKKSDSLRGIILTGETSSLFISKLADSAWPVLHKPANLIKIASALQAD